MNEKHSQSETCTSKRQELLSSIDWAVSMLSVQVVVMSLYYLLPLLIIASYVLSVMNGNPTLIDYNEVLNVAGGGMGH